MDTEMKLSFLPHVLSACSQRNGLRWRSPVQLAFLEAHKYFRNNSIIEKFPWRFLKPYKYCWRVHPPERQARLFKSKSLGKPSAQHRLVQCIIRHQDVEAFMKYQFPPQGDLSSPSQGTHLGETTSCSWEDCYSMPQQIPRVSNSGCAVTIMTAWGFFKKTVLAWKKSACQKPSYPLKHDHHWTGAALPRDVSFALEWLMNSPVTWTCISGLNRWTFSLLFWGSSLIWIMVLVAR